MFGYVCISPDKLNGEEKELYQSCYCGLCHTLGKRYGAAVRMILNYDLVFLAMLLSGGETPDCRKRRCALHPVHPRCACEPSAALESAADMSVLLTWWQLRDGVADHGFFGGLPYRTAAAILGRAYRKAAAVRPDFDRSTREQLSLLHELETEKCPSLDKPADAFATLLAGAAEGVAEESRRRVLREILYHLGRWIYLVDAADDLKKDFENGSYNPLIYRYELTEGKLPEDIQAQFATTLDHSIRLMGAAGALWDFGCWSALIESTLDRGLFYVGGAVLNGSFRKKRKKETP